MNSLETCKKEDTIPKGFQLKLRNTNCRTTEDVVSTQNVLTKTSKTLMCQTLDKLRNTLTDIEIDIKLGNFRLRQEHSHADYENTIKYFQYCSIRWAREKEQKKARKVSSLHRNKDNVTTQVLGDGNCYFRCISEALHGNQDKHVEIRKRVVQELTENKEKYEAYIDDYENHIDNMKHIDGRISSYATEAEIYATTIAFSLDIFERNKTREECECLYSFNSDACSHDKPFIAITYENSHYNHIFLNERPCKCTAALDNHQYNSNLVWNQKK